MKEIRVGQQKIRGLVENTQSNKAVILAHGFTGNYHGPDNIFDKLSDALQRAGYAVLRFNYRGTPPSDGAFKDMTLSSATQDLKAVLDFASDYNRICLLGESMGGNIALRSFNEEVDALVLWYPAIDMSNTSVGESITADMIDKAHQEGHIAFEGHKLGADFLGEVLDSDMLYRMQKIASPVLILHGDNDTTVPVEQAKQAFAHAKNPKEIHILEGAGHCFYQVQEEAISITVDFIQKYI